LIYIVAGVSGVGKTTIAQALSKELGLACLDADDFHPVANKDKMSKSIPLDDKDREPWLVAINKRLRQEEISKGVVLACSALKNKYRRTLEKDLSDKIFWIFLEGSFELIYQRMKERKHFMPASLLESQFDAYEKEEGGLHLDVAQSPEQILKHILEHIVMTEKAEIGLIGLGVMGKSLSRNIARNGFKINVYNRHVAGKEENVAKGFVTEYAELKQCQGFDSMEKFINSLSSPRKVFLMVNAGAAVDAVIEELLPFLKKEDLIIDGGNSHYKDTERRFQHLKEKEIGFIGSGVSGGELGALHGPSIMPGGSEEAYAKVEPILTAIAAKDKTDKSCCAFIGKAGAGHFVKMVHNGIEYAEMQLIAEAYGILRFSLGKSPDEIAELFSIWNQGESASYLLEITIDILRKKDGDTHLIDIILDKAGNKGTGSWTTIAACELGVAIPTITAALFARYQSAQYDARQNASTKYKRSIAEIDNTIIKILQPAYQQARLINHHQGFNLIHQASEHYGWEINKKQLARIWTNGCIIRSSLMEKIFTHLSDEERLIMHPKLNASLLSKPDDLASLVSALGSTNISAPCFTASLQYLNGFAEKQSLANIIQAQRDYFGAHTYERKDAPRGKKFHTTWV